MYDNEYSVIIVLIGFIIIVYFIFSNKNNRKYPVYKTKNYDIKKSININANMDSVATKNISISVSNNNNNNNNLREEDLKSKKIQKQMSLPLNSNKEKTYIIINSIAKKYYTVKDIYTFMDKKNIFMNDFGYFNKYHVDRHTRIIKYSVVNVTNPGYLDKEKIDSLKIKGLSFFMQLPIETNPMETFNEMIGDAKLFTKKYDGILYDSKKILLSNKIIKNLKKSVETYNNEY